MPTSITNAARLDHSIEVVLKFVRLKKCITKCRACAIATPFSQGSQSNVDRRDVWPVITSGRLQGDHAYMEVSGPRHITEESFQPKVVAGKRGSIRFARHLTC